MFAFFKVIYRCDAAKSQVNVIKSLKLYYRTSRTTKINLTFCIDEMALRAL